MLYHSIIHYTILYTYIHIYIYIHIKASRALRAPATWCRGGSSRMVAPSVTDRRQQYNDRNYNDSYM